MKARPWQIVVIAVGLLVLIGSIFLSLRGDKVQLADKIHLLDVVTGEAFVVDTDDGAIILPALHPETGAPTLVRMGKNEEGHWTASLRDLAAVRQTPGIEVKAVDPQTGRVLIDINKMTRYRRK